MANEFCIKQKFYISYHKGMLINIQSCFLQGCIVVFISSSFQLTFSLRFKLGLNMSIKHKAMKFFLKSRIKYTFDSNLHLVYIIVLQCTHNLFFYQSFNTPPICWMDACVVLLRSGIAKVPKKEYQACHKPFHSTIKRVTLHFTKKPPKLGTHSISKDNQSNQ